MQKQIIPADNIFIRGENSSWKMLPPTDTSHNGSGPMQGHSFKRTAASGMLHTFRNGPVQVATSGLYLTPA